MVRPKRRIYSAVPGHLGTTTGTVQGHPVTLSGDTCRDSWGHFVRRSRISRCISDLEVVTLPGTVRDTHGDTWRDTAPLSPVRGEARSAGRRSGWEGIGAKAPRAVRPKRRAGKMLSPRPVAWRGPHGQVQT